MPNRLIWSHFIKDSNSNVHLHSCLPESMVGNLPVTIQLELSFKVKNKTKNKQTQYVLFAVQISSDFGIPNSKTMKLKICLAMAEHVHFGSPSDVFARLTGGEKDQQKEPNRVAYTCSIIKIH